MIGSAAMGSDVRRQLSEAGYIRLHDLRTGKHGGQPQLCEPTEKAEELLRRVGVTIKERRGKGGIVHQYAQHVIKNHFVQSRPGARVTIEDGSSGKSVDLTVVGEQLSLAVEICIAGIMKEMRNLDADLRSYAEVLLVTDEPEKLRELREEVGKAFDESERQKIRFALLAEFIEKEH